MNQLSRRTDLALVTTLAVLLGTTLVLSLLLSGPDRQAESDGSVLTKPIRLEETHPEAIEELFLGLRVHHYRPQPIGDAEFIDYFFDTENWDLYRSGYSYRFRIRLGNDSDGRHAVRLEREPRFSGIDEDKIDIRSDLPFPSGSQIEEGNWQLAVDAPEQVEARIYLQSILSALDLEPEQLRPRLRGELKRSRFDISDKGQSWFELDVEDWSFSLEPEMAGQGDLKIRNFVFDTRLRRDHPELIRRVQTLQMLSGMFHGSQPSRLAPHEQALQDLIGAQKEAARHDPTAGEASPDEIEDSLARVLSLPYVKGKSRAPRKSGVLRHDETRAYQGVNLYVSGHGPEARLIDMNGRLLHRWRYAFEDAFPAWNPSVFTSYLRRAHVFSNGDLLAIYQGGGMIRIDKESRLLWISEIPYFNHFEVLDNGRIVAIAKKVRPGEATGEQQLILEDSIVVLSPDGVILDRVSLLDCFLGSSFESLIRPFPDHQDIFHTNSVQLVETTGMTPSDLFRNGDYLVSLREHDVIAFVDPQTQTVRHAWQGPWRAQHQPELLPTGTILLFDNQGIAGRSRVLELDPSSDRIVWEYSGSQQDPLLSLEAGSCQRLPNGNTLITDSEKGRALEVSSDLEPLWEFTSPHRVGDRDELVAMLFDVVRIPLPSIEFLPTHSSR